jgi:hypothetical protein
MRSFVVAFAAAVAWAQGPQAPDVIVLNDAALGAVTFQHKLHEERAEGKCETCHHASRPEKPQTRPYQACRECHTRPVQEGMKTIRQAAFHNPPAQSGTCADCHKRQLAAGKKPPQKCFDCHKKEARAALGRPGASPWALPHRTGSLETQAVR